jgi:hypothetical protein
MVAADAAPAASMPNTANNSFAYMNVFLFRS